MSTKPIVILAAVACFAGAFAAPNTGEGPADEVNPFIGCSYNGHCYAAAAYPFGLVQAGPDTGNTWWDYCSGYRYADERILGFSQTHISGTGCGDLGDLLVMPFTGEFDHSRTNYTSRYRKETQQAKPGYYAVTLDDNHARVEVTVTHHAAIYRIQYSPTCSTASSTGTRRTPSAACSNATWSRWTPVRFRGACARRSGSTANTRSP